MTAIRKYCIALILSGFSLIAYSQHEEPKHQQGTTEQHEQSAESHHDAPAGAEAHSECGHPIDEVVEGEYNAGDVAVHHIADANAVHILGELYLHLPCFLYAPGHGWTITTLRLSIRTTTAVERFPRTVMFWCMAVFFV